MSNKNVQRRTKFHDFKDKKGKSISYAVLCAVLGESEQWVRTLLKQEKAIPTDVHKWIKDQLAPGTKKINELKMRQEEAEALLKEAKVEELTFKNEVNQGKYGLVEDFQRTLDGILIRLQTNLYAIPEQVVDAIMTSRDRTEGKAVLLEALEHHMTAISEMEAQLGEEE